MRFIKLKTVKEIAQTGLFRLDFQGNHVGLIRKSHGENCQSGTYYHIDNFGQDVLVCDHETIHSNAVKMNPEIVAEIYKDGFVSHSIYKALQEKFGLLNRLFRNEHIFKIAELEKKIDDQEKELCRLRKK